MTYFPANIGRVPNLLTSQLSLGNLRRTGVSLFDVQTQLSTGRAINRPSDDIVKAATISLLDERLESQAQRYRNLENAQTSLSQLDTAIGDASDLVLQAKQIASSQVGLGASAEERNAQAAVIDSLIDGLYELVSRDTISGFLFGGSTPGTQPVTRFEQGFLSNSGGAGLRTDLGLSVGVPLTLGADQALGGTIARFQGTAQLPADLTPDTRIRDLLGTRQLGVTTGEITLASGTGPTATIDLSTADTVEDVAQLLETAIRDYETTNGVTILGPAGVGSDTQGLTFALLGPPTTAELTFTDSTGNFTARDLGLASEPTAPITAAAPNAGPLNPKLTPRSDLTPLTPPALGSIRVENLGKVVVVDLSAAETIQDVRNAIEGANLGVTVEIDPIERRLFVVNQASAGSENAMSISEVAGNDSTASRLGIRTLAGPVRIDTFNGGRGVDVLSGIADPTTGLLDPALNVDFTITLGDGQTIDIDLAPGDMITAQTFMDAVNAQANAQTTAPTDFQIGINANGPGFVLQQDPALGGAISVLRQNNSVAADQLGLESGSYDPTSATFTTDDPSKVRVDSTLSHLIDLRDALRNDDTRGITLAGEQLEVSVARLAESRALVGGYARRIETQLTVEEDRTLLDEQTRSTLRDVDFTEAATQFSLLQTQLQAGYQVTAQAGQLTLLDFLG